MRDFLEGRNRNLIRDVTELVRLLQETRHPDEVEPYRRFVLSLCNEVKCLSERNLSRLQFLTHVDILEDLVSETHAATRIVRQLSSIYAVPILRASESDRLTLRIVQWLHQTHSQTADYFPAFSDGHWSVFPFPQIPIYYLPSIDQRGLLYQPLNFHEFGHVLYTRHKRELDELVGDFQEEILGLLSPNIQRNDRFAKRQALRRQVVADRWYSWLQELFCDAVGFTIGGPCFLHAFSSTLSSLHPSTLYQGRDELKDSGHPVAWLRIQLLAKRAEAAGFVALTRDVENLWLAMSEAMGIVEDYHGYYDGVLEPVIVRTIDDMLTETAPRHYLPHEVEGSAWSPSSDSPIRLLNWAWQVYLANPEEYRAWEAQRLDSLTRHGDVNS